MFTVTSAPVISDVSVTSRPPDGSNTFKRGERIEISVTFNQAVEVQNAQADGANVRIKIWVRGSSPVWFANFLRMDHPRKLVFGLRVTSGLNDADGLCIGSGCLDDAIGLSAGAAIVAAEDGVAARTSFDAVQTSWRIDSSTQGLTGGVCDRHLAVRAAIVAKISAASTCAEVTDTHLAGIGSLDLSGEGIDSLHKGDFEGLTGLTELDLSGNALDHLPVDLFEHLGASLRTLKLNGNPLGALPAGVFDGLTGVKTLDLGDTGLTELPAGLFADLGLLEELRLVENRLRAFPAAALADVAGTLQRLFMRDNGLESIAAGAFDGMTQLRQLELQNNALASLPDDLLRPLTQLEIVQLYGNPGFTGFAPVVEAIPAQSFERGQWGQRVDLEAVLGASPWGDNVIWSWPQTGSSVTLNDADTATPWFNAPTVDADTTFNFAATATGRGTSGAGASEGARTARVTVQGPASIDDVSVTSRPVDGSETFKRGDHIEVTVTFSEPVRVTVGGGISIGLRIGASFIDSDFHRQEHPSKLIFRHVVVAADIENRGIVIGNDPETPFGTGEDDITLTAASIRAVADGTNARVDFDVQQTPWEVDGNTEAPTGGICGHGYHPKVLAAILDAVPGGNTSCDDVTDVHLAGIASLDLSSEAIDSLHKRDFEGLTGLTEINLADNALDRLPGDLFEHVATLTRLQLRGNDIAALPASVFDGLTALTTLDLRDNALTGLPAGVFDDLTDLRTLRLQDNALASLPDNVFAPLTKLLNGGLLIQGNPGFEDFVPRVTVSVPAQTVRPGVRVDLEAIVEPNPWGSNLVWSWTRTDTGGETVTLEDADSRVAHFVAPAPAVETELAFEVTATGRGTAGVASPSKATEAAAVTVREATPPKLTGAEVGASGDTLTLTFNKELDNGPGKLPPRDAFTVRADGDKVAVQDVTEGGGPDNFVLRLPNNAVTEDQTVTVSYAVPESGTAIEDTVGNDALALTYFEATNNSTVDVTAPVPESGEVGASGDILTLTFNEDLDRTAGVPPASAFTVKADGVAVAVQSVVAQALDQLFLTLPTAAIKQGQTVTVSYAVPESGTVIEDTSGNDALAFTDFEVDNNSTADGTPPIPASAEVGAHGGSLALTFNENLDIGPVRVPPASAFTVKVDGVEVPVQSVAVSAGTFFDTLLLNLSSTIGERQIVTVSYEVPDTGTVIADVAGNEAAEFEDFPVTNNSTVANTTPPVPASAEVWASGNVLALTFNEDLDFAAGFPPASAFTVKADGVVVTVQSVTGAFEGLLLNLSSTIKQGQTVTVSYEVPDTGTVIEDTAGNDAVGFTDFAVNNDSNVDGIPPVPASAEVGASGNTLTVTFNEDLDIGPSKLPPADAFTVKADGVEVTVQDVRLLTDLDHFVLLLSPTIKQGQTVTVSYAVPESGTVIEDTAGNDAVGFTDFAVNNDSNVDETPPVPASAEVWLSGNVLALTFNEDLDFAAGFPPASAFTVKADGVVVTVQSVTGAFEGLLLNLSSTIGARQIVTVSYAVPATGTVIADVAGNDALAFTDFEVDNNSTVILDETPPVPASAEVWLSGNVLALTFNEDLDFAAGFPPASAFTVKADSVVVTVQSVTGAFEGLLLNLSSTIGARQIVTVSYAVPATGTVIADVAGNDAVAFEDFPVTNNSTVANTTPPVPASAEVWASGAVLALTFNEDLDFAAGFPPASAFTVKADGVVVTVQSVTGAFEGLLLSLPDEAINQCQTVTVDYEVPTTNPIQDTDDDAAVGFTDFAVDNNSTVECPNLNDPVFGGDDPRVFSVEENVPLGTDIGGPVTATDADRDTLTYSVDPASPHASYFQIDSATGQLRTNVANGRVFSHENDPNEYDIIVVADDGRGRTAQIAVVVSVTDVNEPPDAPVAVTVTGSGTTSLEVTWTAPPNAGRPDIEDYDVQYREAGASQWTDGPQDVDVTRATIMSVDAAKSYEVQVRATNDEGDGPWAVWGLTITLVTIEAEHEEIGGGLEDLKFTLTREGGTTDALVATVTIVQEQSWLGNSDLEHEVAFLPGYATAELTIAASKFSFTPSNTDDLTARVSGAGIFGGSDTVEVVSTAEPPITVGLDMSAYTFAEDATDEAVYVVAKLHPDYPRPPARARDFGVAVSTGSDTATFREDYVSISTVVDFFADDYRLVGGRYVARKAFPDFAMVSDNVYEGTEGLVVKLERSANLNTELVNLENPDGTLGLGAEYPVTITDEGDLPVLSLSVDPSSIAEEDDDGTTAVAENVSTVTVGITNGKTFAVDRTVTLTFSGATQGTHYSVSPVDDDTNTAGHQVVLAKETASLPPVTVTAAGNDTADGNLTLTVMGDLDGRAIGTRDITILDDDDTTTTNDPAGGAPGIMGTPQEGHELTATLGSMADTDVLPATFPDDYDFQWVRLDSSNNPTNVGTNSSTYTVLPTDVDSTIRVDVSFTDLAGNLEGPLSSPAVGPVVALLPELSFAETTVDVDETAGTVELTVNLAPASTGQVTVDYATSNGPSGSNGAEAGEDYTAQSDTLTFTAGETSKTITIQITDDDIHEAVERFFVDLANPSGATESATAGKTEVHITSEDSVPTVSMNDVTVDEGAGTMRLTLQLSHPSSGSIVYLTDSGDVGGTATVSEDYADFLHSVNDTIIEIVAGERTKDFDITIIDDGAAESDETITIEWTKNSADPATPDVLNFTGTITDNDGGTATAPAIVTDGVQVTSTPAMGDTYGLGETIEITVTFDNAVTVDTSGGTPRIQFRLGPPRDDRWAEYSRGSGGTALVFTYTVQSGDMDNDGIWLEGNFLQLQSGTIRAAADNTTDATLTYAEPGLQTEHKVDGSVEGSPPLAPAAPGVNGVGDSDTSLKVTWRAPDNTGRPPITHYDLRYRETGTGTSGWQDGPQDQTATNATNATIGSLTTGTQYDVQVRASNADGDGPWSPSGQGTPGVVETVETIPNGSLRLVVHNDEPDSTIGPGTGAGRLEVYLKKNGKAEWGTVCEDRFDSETFTIYGPNFFNGDRDDKQTVDNIAPELACQLMGKATGEMVTRPGNISIAPESQKIWLDDVRCAAGSTTESTPGLQHCYHAGVGLHNCRKDHMREDVHLQCTGTLNPESATQEEEAAPLTASFEDLPETHDGATAFTFRLVLSADIANGDVDVRDSAFEVTGGSVTDVGRVDGRSDLWEITVTPDGTGNVGIVLLPARACGTAGALCTGDGRALTTALLVTVPASPQQAGALTAVFADMPAEHGGAAGFTFTLRFSESFPIGYVTMRDHAFTVTNGRVTRARRLDNPHHENQGMQPNREWEITVAPDTGAGDVTITLPETTDCAATGAVCTEDGTMLSGAVSVTVPHTYVDPNAAAVPPLRASFANVPAEHDGGTVFTFEVRFSEAFRLSYVTMRDDVLTVTNGRVTRAQRLDNPHHEHEGMQPNRTWKISVRPDAASEDVTIVLPATTSCDASGAVCTGDGRKLSNTESATVAGPPSLSIADAQVDEAADATLEFTVSLSRAASETVTVDWATADGTATAGSDYTTDSGTLTFAPDETSKTVAVAVLDDSHDEGNETLTVTLSNPSGAYLADGEATGTIENTDHMPQAWLGRFGRTVAEQVLDAVEERIRSAPQAGMQVTVAGQRIGAAQAPDADALEEAEAQARLEDFSTWLAGEAEARESRTGSRSVAPRELLTGSSFALTTGADGIGGGLVSLWGRGAVSSFDGREGELSLSGEVTGAMLGADWTRERSTLGLMLSHARGEGSYREADSGKVSSTVTGLYPYGRYALSDRVTVWGAAGYGAGTLTLTPEDGEALKTDMDLMMAAAGLRGTVVEAPPEGGPELAVKTDAMAVRTSSEAVRGSGDGGAGNLAAATADVTRLRLGLEGTWRGLEIGTGTLVPRLELGVRHDGGDAETGFGLDLGGGLAWSDPGTGLRAEVSGRGLLTHESAGFRDLGFSGALAWDPTPGSDRGPSLTLSQTMGVSERGGADALLGRTTLAGLAANDNGDELERRRLELRLGYGFGAFGDRFTATPEVGFGMSKGHRDYSLAWRFVRDRRRGDIGSLEFSVEARRRESANDDTPPEHTVGLRLTARF